MKRVLFLCHGNICRSPMAEVVFTDLVKKAKAEEKYLIDSAAVSREELGNSMYPPAVKELKRHGLCPNGHRAWQISPSDYEKWDLFICMDDSNLRLIKRIFPRDPDHKIKKLLEYTDEARDVEDPWYTGRYDFVFNDIENGCQALLKNLEG